MKRILNVTGVTRLCKKEQKSIKGARRSAATCCPNRDGYCVINIHSFPGSFCERGHCQPDGSCIYA